MLTPIPYPVCPNRMETTQNVSYISAYVFNFSNETILTIYILSNLR